MTITLCRLFCFKLFGIQFQEHKLYVKTFQIARNVSNDFRPIMGFISERRGGGRLGHECGLRVEERIHGKRGSHNHSR